MSAVVDFPVKPEARPYVDAFVDNPHEPQWLRNARRASLNRFAELGFPNRRSENWRYFDLRDLATTPLPPAAGAPLHLSHGDLPEGVWLGSVERAKKERPELLLRLANGPAGDVAQPFAALNGAFLGNGYILGVVPGSVLDGPIEIVHGPSESGSSHTRDLVDLGAGSEATIVETFTGESGRYWRNDLAAVRLEKGAKLTRVVLVEEGAQAIHTALTDVRLCTGARFVEFVLLLGGNRVRHEVNVCLAGEGATCEIVGAYVVGGDDEANVVTAIDHAAPGGETRELVKGVAAGRGHGAFQGKIVVREHAQKSDAHQLSRNLLLGRRAVIDTKPELEILADDVKCSHGASVGDLDEAALFYLRARGIPAAEARHMLIEGFLSETVADVADRALREHLLRRLAVRLGKLEE